MCSWSTLSLLLHHRSDVSYMPNRSIFVILQSLLQLMYECFVIRYKNIFLINHSQVFEVCLQVTQIPERFLED
jgi:hypothetical protein